MLLLLLTLAADPPALPSEGAPPAPVVEAPPAPLELEGDQLLLPERIYFDFDSPKIKPESFATLDAIAATLIAHPEWTRVEVAVHSDDRGSASYSICLTCRRAQSVLQALVERGVPEERLSAKGYDDTLPIAPNTTAEGRAQNRRVELWIRERADD
ncbi:MAG: OmpA family protein [Alphaproteobacteria bacterium]|nr:OmpA family protein [Alphaproteobacteria bacterium]